MDVDVRMSVPPPCENSSFRLQNTTYCIRRDRQPRLDGSGGWSAVLCTEKVAGSIPGQGTSPAVALIPGLGAY